MLPRLLSNLLKVLSNLSPNIRKIGILHTGRLATFSQKLPLRMHVTSLLP